MIRAYFTCSLFWTRNLALSTSCWATCLTSTACVKSRPKLKWVREMSSNPIPKEAAPKCLGKSLTNFLWKASYHDTFGSVVTSNWNTESITCADYSRVGETAICNRRVQEPSKGNFQQLCPLWGAKMCALNLRKLVKTMNSSAEIWGAFIGKNSRKLKVHHIFGQV